MPGQSTSSSAASFRVAPTEAERTAVVDRIRGDGCRANFRPSPPQHLSLGVRFPSVSSDLASAARNGDNSAFALLIEGQLAGMRAVAIAMLGYTEDIEDVLQDAVLVAMRGIAEIRDVEAAGPWLRGIVRNLCRMRYRLRHQSHRAPTRFTLPEDPARILEQAATQDWVWHAVTELSEPVREVVILRYFTDFSSYRQISELCGISEHAVRGRLRDGRRTLEQLLRAEADRAHADSRAASARTRHEAEDSIQAGVQGGLSEVIRDRFHPEALVTRKGEVTNEVHTLIPMMNATLDAGVGLRLLNAAASDDVVVWEIEFLNPAYDPRHCPPAMAWLHTIRGGRTQHLRIAYQR